MQGAMADPDWIIYCDALILGGYLQKKKKNSYWAQLLNMESEELKLQKALKKQNIDELSHVQLQKTRN